jgi:hypothetical protein
MRNRLKRIGLLIFFLLVLPILLIWVVCVQPSHAAGPRSARTVPAARLKEHVLTLSEKYHPRSYAYPANLNLCAAYILDHFQKAGAQTELQEYAVGPTIYKNVRAFFGPESGGRLVVGAHYDAYSRTPGADDNASGVAGLIELAYLLGDQTNLPKRIELVAYTLEEPPFFRSKDMGSYRHARLLRNQNMEVQAMLSLEMIGYFTDEKGVQRFPLPIMRFFYPRQGNFVTVVGNLSERGLVRRIKAGMNGATDLPVHSVNAPWFVPGIDLSDHRNYWKLGFDAVMITDTAFYRNREYHKSGDTADRLDYDRMGKVVVAVFEALKLLARDS